MAPFLQGYTCERSWIYCFCLHNIKVVLARQYRWDANSWLHPETPGCIVTRKHNHFYIRHIKFGGLSLSAYYRLHISVCRLKQHNLWIYSFKIPPDGRYAGHKLGMLKEKRLGTYTQTSNASWMCLLLSSMTSLERFTQREGVKLILSYFLFQTGKKVNVPISQSRLKYLLSLSKNSLPNMSGFVDIAPRMSLNVFL